MIPRSSVFNQFYKREPFLLDYCIYPPLRSKMGFTAGSEKKPLNAYMMFTIDLREKSKKTTRLGNLLRQKCSNCYIRQQSIRERILYGTKEQARYKNTKNLHWKLMFPLAQNYRLGKLHKNGSHWVQTKKVPGKINKPRKSKKQKFWIKGLFNAPFKHLLRFVKAN